MNRSDYLAALRRALSSLPAEECANALRYYEEYFDEAGPENEARAAQELGDPAEAARQILADYQELTPAGAPQQQGAQDQPGAQNQQSAPQAPPSPAAQPIRRGINPWMLLALFLLSPIWVPVGLAVLGTVVGVLFAIFAILFAIAIVLAVIPLCLLITGIALIGFSFALWGEPPSAVVTLGCGLICLGLGVLSTVLFIWLCRICVPPVFRAFIAVLRWPFDRIAGRRTVK